MIIQASTRYSPSGRKRKTNAYKKAKRPDFVAQAKKDFKGAVAQSGERVLCKHEVVGSIPSSSTNEQYPSVPMGKYTPAKDSSWKVEASKNFTVAPAYNKGAYQVIPRDDVEHIGK